MKEINCIYCNSTRKEIILRGEDCLGREKVFQIVRCKECGLSFVNPQPSSEELREFYQTDYESYNEPELIKYGFITRKISSFIHNFFHRQVKRQIIDIDGRINYLDFGCGGGFNLERVQKKHPSWKFYGYDNNQIACQKTKERGFPVYCGELEEISWPNDFFDIINMNHVVEHLSNPSAGIKKIRTLIKKGGILRLTTPNFDSLSSKLFKGSWQALELPRHLFFFNLTTLKNLLEQNRFKVTSVKFGKSPRIEILSFFNLFKCQDRRINPFVWRLFIPIAWFLSRLGKSSIISVEAVAE